MLTIWGRLNSHNVKKVVWLAEELGLTYERRDVGGTFGMDEAYLAKNPNALIPTIEDRSVDGGLVLWESNAILRYLAARHRAEALWPTDPGRRALADRWMDWQHGYAEAQRPAFMGLVRQRPEQRDVAAIERSMAAARRMMAILDDALAQTPWLSGEAFGIGDIPMGTYAHTFFTLDDGREPLPHVAAWYARLQERPEFAQNVAIPLT